MQAHSYKAVLLTFQPKLTQTKLLVMERAVRENKKRKKRGWWAWGLPSQLLQHPFSPPEVV